MKKIGNITVHDASDALAQETKEPEWYIDGGGIVSAHNNEYAIEGDDIEDPIDAIRWIHHLCGKRWVDTDSIEDFIGCVLKLKGWRIY